MPDTTFTITFPSSTKAEANRFSQSLADVLVGIDVEKAQPARDNPEAQDFGATLVLVLGSAAATAVAKGIKSWVERTGAEVNIDGPNGKACIKNVRSADLAEIVKALQQSPAK